MKLRMIGGAGESPMLVGTAWVVFKRTGDADRPLVFFGVEDNAMSLYPDEERATAAQGEAATLRGGEWQAGKVIWGWGAPPSPAEQSPEDAAGSSVGEMIAAMEEQSRVHKVHRDIVRGWLREAGFHPQVEPAGVVFAMRGLRVWCGSARLSGTRAIELNVSTTSAHASLVSYGGHRVHHTCTGPSPVEALLALAASGKVPRCLIAPPRLPAAPPSP